MTHPRKRKVSPVQVPQEDSSLLRWLKDRQITEVECLVPDFTGNARGKIIPADKFRHDYGMRLPEGIFTTTVTGDFPDDYDDLVTPADSDMLLRRTRTRCAWCRGPPTRPRR
jgi:glutamine synthetase